MSYVLFRVVIFTKEIFRFIYNLRESSPIYYLKRYLSKFCHPRFSLVSWHFPSSRDARACPRLESHKSWEFEKRALSPRASSRLSRRQRDSSLNPSQQDRDGSNPL